MRDHNCKYWPVLLSLLFLFLLQPLLEREVRAAETVPGTAAMAVAECRWTEAAPTLDGRGDEAAWKNASLIELSIPWDPTHPKLRTRTAARLMWDREYLYFFAEMEDAQIVSPITEHDGMLWSGDVFELFFKPSTRHSGYYEFQVNPTNAVLDCFFPRRQPDGFALWKSALPFHLNTAVQIHAGGWSVEGRIPWSDFQPTGGRPAPGEEWRFTLCRYDATAGKEAELSASAPLQVLDYHRNQDYAPLRFVGPARISRPLWTTSRVIGWPEPPTGYRVERAYSGVPGNNFIAVGTEPGSDRLLFLEHTNGWSGTMSLRRFRDDPAVSAVETLIDLPDMAYGFTFHPGFATNGFLYIGCNGPADKPPKVTRIVRYTLERKAPWRLDPASRLVIIDWPSDGHNGGDICFGNDGMLFVTSGDGTSDSDADNAGQNTASLRSKVLRIDVDHPAPGRNYSVPGDNPFVGQAGFAPETWAYGLRNPWRITLDRESGQLWVGENGQDAWEYARLVQRGANYGWSVFEGSHPFRPNRKLGPHPVTPPTLEHSHAEFRSLTGGVVYRGTAFPELHGAYIYGDYSTGRIWAALHNGQRLLWNRELVDTPLAVIGFGVDPRGELLIVDYGGGFYRLKRDAASAADTSAFPQKLSQTGLFLDTAALTPDPALLPYSVNAALWSDGAQKERFLALPRDLRIGWKNSHSWDFPDGAVLVKTFFLPSGSTPTARRRLETRLLTRREGDWFGYTYVWNEAQTDADLLAREGADRVVEVADAAAPGGMRRQTWHFPSRTECMVCHTRAANFVLGLSDAQLNRPFHDTPGSGENQLAHLERLGVLKVPVESTKPFGTEPQRTAPVESDWMLPRSPEQLERLAGLEEGGASLEQRVRSYLAVNCASCHMPTGGGNSPLDLDYTTKLKETHALEVPPTHESFGLANARLLAPGAPDRSVLLQRMNRRGPGQMPPLGTLRVDEQAVALLREWIATLPAK